AGEPMKTLPLRLAAAGVLCCLVPAARAQESRPHEGKRPHWVLCPPLEDAPCPSRLAAIDAPKELVFGTFKLAKPARVSDGDTIHVEGLKESLRFIGLDAEETFKEKGKKELCERSWDEYLKTEMAGHDPARPPKYGTPMGEAAKDAMIQLLDGVSE